MEFFASAAMTNKEPKTNRLSSNQPATFLHCTIESSLIHSCHFVQFLSIYATNSSWGNFVWYEIFTGYFVKRRNCYFLFILIFIFFYIYSHGPCTLTSLPTIFSRIPTDSHIFPLSISSNVRHLVVRGLAKTREIQWSRYIKRSIKNRISTYEADKDNVSLQLCKLQKAFVLSCAWTCACELAS